MKNPELLFHGLIDVPIHRFRRSGIYWLRLYRTPKGLVATVTEVPGNPSLSATNGISHIIMFIGESFQIELEHLAVFVIHPEGEFEGQPADYVRVHNSGSLSWGKM